jgi:hypothetical protein
MREQGTNYYDIGSVRVLEYDTAANPTGWSQVGSDIVGLAHYDYFGSAVAISGDGNRVVIGAQNLSVVTSYYEKSGQNDPDKTNADFTDDAALLY